MKIAIIGAGWYGCHLALSLQIQGHAVTLFEKNSDIFQQISGKFGIRLHLGPHYPRSASTRESCRKGFDEFKQRYPELIVEHDYSIYGLGELDADNLPSKVDKDVFESVCNESDTTQFIDTEAWGYKQLLSAATMDEPSIVLGEELRKHFKVYLSETDVLIRLNTEITDLITQDNGQVIVNTQDQTELFDFAINASSYQSLLPKETKFPLDMEVVYQPCIALMYEDLQPGERPFSFIIMDGWFPAFMPYVTNNSTSDNHYILTHGKWTIMGSFDSALKANKILETLSDDFIQQEIKPNCEGEMSRFWPAFTERFKYIGWTGAVLAKLKTTSEFRSAVTYAQKNIIHVIPGKVSNIFDVEREVIALIDKKNILNHDGYDYVQNGVFDKSITEIKEKSKAGDRSTCELQTYIELQQNRLTIPSSSFFQPAPTTAASSVEKPDPPNP